MKLVTNLNWSSVDLRQFYMYKRNTDVCVCVCVMEEIIKIEKKIISQWANVVQLGLRMIATDVKPD